MMVVFIFLKKRLNEATRAWIETRLFGSLVQIVSTTHKKKYQNHAIRPTRFTGGIYHEDAPALPPFVSSFDHFSYSLA
jgi:hypothetical protein